MSVATRSESRNGAVVRLLAVHSTEGNGTAQDLRDAAWWTGSSHAINDETGTLLTPAEGCVPYERAAWTLRSGNHISDNIEQVGWAHWTRAEWLARPLLLDGTARWLADRSKARGIPLVKLSPADVAAGKSGVIGHVDWTYGMKDGTHTDPGPNYPWDVVLPKAIAYRNGTSSGGLVMDADVAKEFAELRRLAALEVGVQIAPRAPGEKTPGEQVAALIAPLTATVGQLVEAVAKLQAGGSVNVQAIADQLTVVPKG